MNPKTLITTGPKTGGLTQIRDTFREHPDIWDEADRRTKQILERYLQERKIDPCK